MPNPTDKTIRAMQHCNFRGNNPSQSTSTTRAIREITMKQPNKPFCHYSHLASKEAKSADIRNSLGRLQV